jgi:hypothetical protein
VRGGKDIASAAYIPERGEVKSGPYPTSIKKELDIVALGNSVGTGNNALTAQVVLVNSFDELENKKEEVKDKIVFYNYKLLISTPFFLTGMLDNTVGKVQAVQQSMEQRL